MAAGQWEAFLVDNASTDDTAAAVRAELPNIHLIRNRLDQGPAAADRALAACRGQYVLNLRDDAYPSDGPAIASLISHLDSDAEIGAVAGRLVLPDDSAAACSLPSLVTLGTTCFRKSVLDRVGGFARSAGQAAEYDLSLRIANAGFRIDRRDDILFRIQAAFAKQDRANPSEIRDQIRDQLNIATRHLPRRLAEIYWHDWRMRYQALAAHAGQGRAATAGIWWARLRSLMQIVTAPDAVSRHAIETVFEYRRHADMIGDWARRNSVWRVVLADFSDNIWATYNACRSSGLQLRCISDDNPAFDKLVYRDLPIVPASRAFEGGGIDGVIITHPDPAQIEPQFKIIRNYFHGPILRLCQTPKQAMRAQASAA
jgi:glycosyltransferase involved in cell wall biosynthesis